MIDLVPKIKIIESKEDWKNLLKEIGNYDFYHTFDYHELSKSDQEKPILISYKEGEVSIALPLLLRKIFDTSYYDITSVYGYAGPVQKGVDNSFDNNRFAYYFKEFLIENNIVSVFSRLNPFIAHQEDILEGLGEVIALGKVVNIDITEPVDDQRVKFSSTTKRYINRARRLCSVRPLESKEDIKAFKDLYYENMDRVDAKDSYYFKERYFNQFIESEDFETDVLLAIYNETQEIISAAMMVKTNNIIQYHISGTRNDYLHLTPIRLLIDDTRIKGTADNYTYFNLGGGLGSAEDSLFKFKSSFSKDHKDFKIWKYIVNSEVYMDLCNTYANGSSDSFFPLYRSR